MRQPYYEADLEAELGYARDLLEAEDWARRLADEGIASRVEERSRAYPWFAGATLTQTRQPVLLVALEDYPRAYEALQSHRQHGGG